MSDPIYIVSLAAVVGVAVLLFSTALLYGGRMLGLTLYCASVGAWSGMLLMAALPAAHGVARYAVQIGAFVAATFIHAAYDFTAQRRYHLVWIAYVVATAVTLTGVVAPGLLYNPITLVAGPAFWPAMALAITATAIPLWQIYRAHRGADAPRRRQLATLAVSAGVGFAGALLHSVLLSHGIVVPYAMWMVLLSLVILAALLRSAQRAAGRRLLDRSFVYAALSALLTALFITALLWLIGGTDVDQRFGFAGALFFLFIAALAFDPLRRFVQSALARRFLREHAGAEELAVALAAQEERADQASRLAELGHFVSAVAHEVRNPLGVISANVRVLEKAGADAALCDAIRGQVDRAGRFVDELMTYGRPRPLELRMVDLAAIIRLACSTSDAAASGEDAVSWLGLDELSPCLLEVDQGQLGQLFVILFDNARHATASQSSAQCRIDLARNGDQIRVTVDDNGHGVPAALRERLFEPFVTGRKREHGGGGTGLGLAIARGIVERHGGEIGLADSALGGACFRVSLPTAQRVLSLES